MSARKSLLKKKPLAQSIGIYRQFTGFESVSIHWLASEGRIVSGRLTEIVGKERNGRRTDFEKQITHIVIYPVISALQLWFES